jgi:hypothetical protein
MKDTCEIKFIVLTCMLERQSMVKDYTGKEGGRWTYEMDVGKEVH